jgi:hypothetical protein
MKVVGTRGVLEANELLNGRYDLNHGVLRCSESEPSKC